jgi:hypothetical protein
MSPANDILTFTHIDSELFKHDDGEFPGFITIVTAPYPADVVTETVQRMMTFFEEYVDIVSVSNVRTSEISHGDGSADTLLTPSTLVLLLRYSEDRERLIILELATSRETLLIH